MSPNSSNSTAERAGRGVARAWRKLRHIERSAARGLAQLGLSTAAVTVCVWAVRVAVLVSIFYSGLAVAVLLGVVVLALLYVIRPADLSFAEDEEPHWKNGIAGFGLYRGDQRIDPGEPDD